MSLALFYVCFYVCYSFYRLHVLFPVCCFFVSPEALLLPGKADTRSRGRGARTAIQSARMRGVENDVIPPKCSSLSLRG